MNQTAVVESPVVTVNEGISPNKNVGTTDKPCTTIGAASVKTSSKAHRSRSRTTSHSGTSLSSAAKAHVDMRLEEINLEKTKKKMIKISHLAIDSTESL